MRKTNWNVRFIVALCVWAFVSTSAGFSQTSSDLWSGTITCQLNDQDPNGTYSRQETQTWTLSGGGPISPTGMAVYNATWRTTGHGTLQRVQGQQTSQFAWTTNVPDTPANIAITVRASDNRLFIHLWHSQLSVFNGVNGQKQVYVNGVAQGPPTSFSHTAWEWQFPHIEDSPTATNVAGTAQSQGDSGDAELLHHYGAPPPGTSCQWQLSKGGNTQNPGQGSMGNGAPNNQNPQNSQTGTTGSTSSNQNCETPASVQQSFEAMKANIKSNYDGLIQGTTDQSQIASLQQQEQRMLTSLNNQEQRDMQAAASGCVTLGQSVTAQTPANSTPANSNPTNSNPTNSNPTNSNPSSTSTGSSQNPTGTAGQGNQSSGSSSMAVSLTTSTSGSGNGNVAITPFGTSCGGNCMQYAPGTSVTVIAVPNSGSMFSGFSGGACGATNPCSFQISASTTVTAAFGLNSSGGSTSSNPGNTGSSTGLRTGTPNQVMVMAMLTGVSPATNSGQSNVTVTLTGQGTHFATGSTKVSFARSATQPQATSISLSTNAALQSLSAGKTSPPALQAGQVQAPTATSLSVPVTMNPATAAGSYDITVTTPTSGGTETVTLKNVFTVTNAPSLSGVNLTTPVVTKNIGSSSTTPPAPTSATYRVTMTGLMCLRAISSDDAIYGAAVIRQYDRRSAQATMFTNANTWVYGDVNGRIGQRQQAGTRGPGGGIGNGDFVPTGFNPGLRDTLPPQVNLFPMTLWQGTLTDGVDALVISPSLWINYGDNPLFSTWNQNENSFTSSLLLASSVQNQINTQALGMVFLGPSENVMGSAAQSVVHDATTAIIDTILVIPFIELGGPSHDRPIGLTDANPSDPTSSTILPNATLVLTREMIEKRLGSNSWTILPIDFKDTAHGFTNLPGSDRPGEYQMFIQIERQ
jgi:hypothetical protein